MNRTAEKSCGFSMVISNTLYQYNNTQKCVLFL